MAPPSRALIPSSFKHGNPSYLIVQSTVVAIATLLVMTRVYVRLIVVKKYGLDDTMIILSLALSLVVCVMTTLTSYYATLCFAHEPGAGVEDNHYLITALKWSSIAAPIGVLSALCARISICLFLLRIFGTKKRWRLALYTIIPFAISVSIPGIVGLLAQCSPVERLWDPLIPGTCWSTQTVVDIWYFNGAASVLCDWTLATLPVVFLWSIQMKARVKIGICVLMGFGYFTGVCAIERTVQFTNSTVGTIEGGSVEYAIWAILEINIGIIAATIPTLRPLFNESRFPILRYLQYIGTYFRDRRASANTPAEDGNDRGRPPRLILNTLPSALPTSMSYYRNKIRDRVGGWRDLESRISIPNLENVHLKDTRVQQMPHP